MRLLFIALFLSAQVVSATAQQQSAPAAEPEAARLLIAVAGNDKGAAFLRHAKSTMERLRGRVISAERTRNTVLKRDETKIVLAFDSTDAAGDFMNTLAGAGGTGGASGESGSNYQCVKEGMSKVCYFRFGDYRFVCVQTYKHSGVCGQI
jgi:hypothetical protein